MIPGGYLTVGGLSGSALLREPVHEALQRHQLRHYRAAERHGLRWLGSSTCWKKQQRFLTATARSTMVKRPKCDIEHVSFSGMKQIKQLIENFNLHAKPGMRIAIVGPTGCGKTTFINLLMRFYDIGQRRYPRGRSAHLRHVTRHALSSNYGMVLQDTWIKSGTVRENICIGKARRHRRGDQRGSQGRSHSWEFIRTSSRRTGHRFHRGQHQPGTETAALHHPCHALPAAHADSGRGHLQHRYPYRAADSGSL